ncbi:Yip1 family protein [Streptomyces sp. NBC_00094]|uniref:Yip1 family protein n=1 Tax=Streptomyces sp. NBC_00094 TaxID=2903620 RepID=UPI002256048B|nr:Yip1 family protein [Streptomyces sp. NBC_00094]MCX5391681.1 YIP1 family protein [Streptomyces sp. NBC_00094]
MAGFRNGRGRDNRPPQQQQQQPQQAPYGYDAAPPPYPQQQQWPPQSGQYGGQQGGPQSGQYGGQYGGPQGQSQQPYGEPEYFGDPHGQQPRSQQPHPGTANNPGHTQMFSVDDPYGGAAGYQAPPAPTGPRLPWKALLSGIVLRPADTFLRMRDHAVWGPALIVTFLYGLLAIFGFDKARDEAINATLSTAIPYVLMTALGFVVGGLILGAVTHTLARQLGGDGSWQPTVGLSMLIMSITDAPRLVFALFLGGENGLVQVVGWLTWLALGALLTLMVSRSHDLPWPKALGASAIQLVALLSLIKLGTL